MAETSQHGRGTGTPVALAPRQAPPRAGETWRRNGSDRTVRIESTDSRWAEVRNVETGRFSRMELYTFNRRGKAGWTRLADDIEGGGE